MKNQVVISQFEADLEWTKELDEEGFDVIAYQKGKKPVKDTWITVHKLPNVGREIHTFLHHIIENYENLPPITVFLQDNPREGNFGKIDVENLAARINENEILHIGSIIGCDEFGRPHHHGILPIREYWDYLFTEPIFETIMFVAASQHAVPASFIHKRPLEWWKRAINHPHAQVNPEPVPACKPPWAWCMERMMSVVFHGDVEGKLE